MCIKGHYQESEKTTYRVGENTCRNVSDEGLVPRIYKGFVQQEKDNLI